MKLAYTLFAFLLSMTIATAQQTVWTGAIDQNWSNAGNWSDGLPAEGKTAVIPGSATTPVQASNLTLNFPVQNSGTIVFTGTVTNANNFVNFTGGTITNNAVFTNNGTVQFDNGGKFDNFSTFDNFGTVSQSGPGQWNNKPLSIFINESTGVFLNNGQVINEGTVTNNGNFTTGTTVYNKGLFNNNLTLLIGFGSGNFDNNIQGDLNNNVGGTVDVQGLLKNNGDVVSFGAFKVSATGKFDNFANFTNNSVARNFGITENYGIYNNGLLSGDTVGVYQYNDYGATFKNFLTLNNFGTLELMPCSEFYQESASADDITGRVWLMGIVYELQGNIDESSIMGGVVLTNSAARPAPTARCKNATVTIGAGGSISILPSLIDNGSTASYCEIQSQTVSPNSFNCSAVGNRVVTMTVTDAKGNTSTCTSTVTVQPSAACSGCFNITNPGVITGAQTICSGDDPNPINNVVLASGGVGTVEYVWIKWTVEPLTHPNDFTMIPGSTGSSYDPGPLTQTTWFRRCSRTSSCADFIAETNIIKITVNEKPNPQIAITQPDCIAPTGSILVSNLQAGTSVRVDNQPAQLDKLNWSNLAPGPHTLTATKNGCSTTVNFTIQNFTNNAPVPTLIATSPACNETVGSIQITNLPAGYSSRLDNGPWNAGQISYSNLAPGTYTVTIGVNSCERSASATIGQPVSVPQPQFSLLQPACGAPTGGIILNNLPSGYYSKLDNGTANPGQNSYLGLLPGNYSITIGKDGCEQSANFTINNVVNNTPDPILLITQPTCAVPTGSAVITNLPAGYSSRLGNGVWSSQTNYSNLAPGNYTVTIGQNGCDKSLDFTIVPVAPTAPNVVCKSITVVLVNGQAIITAIELDGGSTAGCGSIVNYSISQNTFTSAGTFTVILTVTNSYGLSSTCPAQVIVSSPQPPPCVNLTSAGQIAGDQTICPNGDPAPITSVSLPGGGSGEIEYVWIKFLQDPNQFPNDFTMIEGANGPTYDPGPLTQTTWFRRCARRQYCSDFVGESNNVKITVNNTPPTAVCRNFSAVLPVGGGTITLNASDIDNGSFSNFGNITSWTVTPNTFTAPGTYTVILSVTTTCGLASTCTATVTITQPTPQPTTCPNNPIVNNGFEQDFTGWDVGDGASIVTDVVYDGTKAALICPGSSAGGGISQWFPVTAGQTTVVTIFGRFGTSDATWAGFGITYYDANWNEIGGSSHTAFEGTTYREFNNLGTAPAGSAFATVWIWKDYGGGVFVDGICVQPATLTSNCPVQTPFINGGFEYGYANFWYQGGATIEPTAYSGSKAAQVCPPDANGGGFGQSIQVQGGNVVTVTGYARKNTSSATWAGFSITWYDVSWNNLGSSTNTPVNGTSWTFYTHTATAPANARYADIHVWKDLGGAVLVDEMCVSISTSNPPPAPCNKNALLLVGNTTLNLGDNWVKNRLEFLGYTVTIKTGLASTTADANGKGLILISSTMLPSDVNTKFRDAAVPVVIWESAAFDDMKMTGTGEGTNFGNDSPILTALEIVTPGHPLAAGLTGTPTVFNTAKSTRWGIPTASAVVAAKIPGTNRASLFAYETGAAMVGMNAPARRVGIFMSGSTQTYLNANGIALVDAAINWATNCPAQGTQPPPSCNTNALFVVGCLPLGSGDLAIKNRLTALGMTSTEVLDLNVQATDANGKGVVIISSSVASGNVGTRLTNVAVPIVTWEAILYDELKMAGTTSTDQGIGSDNRVQITNASHPIANGLTLGLVQVSTNAYETNWGKPSAAATVIATTPGSTTNAAIFAYEAGASMVGLTAPARRVGLFNRDFMAENFTAQGWRLFDNAIKWATNCSNLNNLAAAVRQEALTFNAFRKGFDVSLKWISNTGAYNDYFVVERSADGLMFQEILRIEGEGAEDEILYFNELDKKPLPGLNFYRIRVVYQNGMETLSEVQQVLMPDAAAFELFPNPAGEYTWLDLKPFVGKKVVIALVNQMGTVVKTIETEAAEEQIKLDLRGLSNGYYGVSILCEGVKRSNRLVISQTF